MYISKSDLIKRLVIVTGKDKNDFLSMSVDELSDLYESYVAISERIYLNVPYKDKNVVKLLGAQYDGENKKWYIPPGVDQNLFNKWVVDNSATE